MAMTKDEIRAVVSAVADGICLKVKAVPGASRSKITGVLGDRLKIAVAAPAEGGKANRAICELIAALYEVAPRDVMVTAGATRPRKTIEVRGVSLCIAVELLQKCLNPR